MQDGLVSSHFRRFCLHVTQPLRLLLCLGFSMPLLPLLALLAVDTAACRMESLIFVLVFELLELLSSIDGEWFRAGDRRRKTLGEGSWISIEPGCHRTLSRKK